MSDDDDSAAQKRPLFFPKDRPWINGLLFLGTLITTFLAGLALSEPAEGTSPWMQAVGFGATVMAILTAHEMGHYVFARKHGVESSLPYFIPLPPPLGLFGTMGAVIRIRARIPDRNALVDIGAAGPLAGLAVALPLLALGTAWSHLGPAPEVTSQFPASNSAWTLAHELYLFLREWLFAIPAPPLEGRGIVTVFGDNLLTLGMTRLFFGAIPGQELYVHPVFLAAWFGLLLSMLNLAPIGQLDGGHLTHALWGEKAIAVGKAAAWVMAFMALFINASWLVWLVVTAKLIGFRHPEVVFPARELTRGRKITCAVSFIFLLLCLMPSPISQAVLK